MGSKRRKQLKKKAINIRGKKIYKDKFNKEYFIANIEEDKEVVEYLYKKKDKVLKRAQYISGIMVIFLIFLFIFIISVPRIEYDDRNREVRYNTEYNNTGYSAKSIFKDYTDKVEVIGEVDTSKVGKYTIEYKLKYLFITISKEKEVFVIDDISPSISLVGDEEVLVCPNKEYIEEGYSASDEYDGDITDKVNIIKEDNEIIYRVKDSSLNEDIVRRKIIYEDKEKPSINLLGSEEVVIYKGNSYKEMGYSASDNCDGDITDKVEVSSNVDSNKVGTYEIEYKVVDSSNNEVSVIRKVRVININNTSDKGVIYLTFDDGPSNLTKDILKILDEEGVKATFFVTGNVNSYKDILREIYNSGHTIGLHSYSHDYSYVYSNKSNYFDDIDRLNDSIESIIGIRSNIIRFPGGSSNTISKNYYNGIMSYLTSEVLNRGYVYFDWNVDSDDAGKAFNDKDKIYYNVISSLSYSRANVVLMHDSGTHIATKEALLSIIEYGKSKGYVFKAIGKDTPMVRHNVNN